MRPVLLFFLLSLLFFHTTAQTFTGTGGSIPGTGTNLSCYPATVSGVGTIGSSFGLSQVCLSITHPNVDELEILLQAPDGTYVPLSIQNGGSGNNYTSTCFTATASTPVKFGTAPFTGSFLPEGHLGAVNNGQNANGTWRLCVLDRRTSSNAGTLNNWSVTFSNTPAPQPPSLPACSSTIPSTSDCNSAVAICDFNGTCGSTVNTPVKTWPALTAATCFGIDNNSFVKFVAAAPTVSFSVWVTSSLNGFNSATGGIQMLFFSTPSCGGAVTTYGCYNRIFPYPTPDKPLISVIYATGLTPGNTYYLLIDGLGNGDLCDFTIAANSGVDILNVTPSAPQICTGQSVNLTATGGNGVYSWSPATNLNTTTGANVTANPTSTTTYTVNSSTALGCPTTKNVTVTVNPLPAAPTASVTAQPSCTTPTGTITVTAPAGAGLEYSLDGTTYQGSTTFTNLTPGAYNLRVRNSSTGCVSNSTLLTVNNLPAAPAAPTGSVTVQPTCTTPTGTIVISAPTSANLEYSINGSSYQSSTAFTGIAPGTYNLTVRNTTTGCISPASSVTVNNLPAAPPAPTASVTVQPTCTIPTGTIVISAPTGANLEYSINGASFQSSATFTGITPGTYNLVVRNTTNGCVSSTSSVTVNNLPAAPPAPTASVTVQPTCTTPTGTIVISAPVGSNLEYSSNGGSYQSSSTFTGMAPGIYNLVVRNSTTGCVSLATSVTVNGAPSAPPAPTVSVTVQPSCSIATGTVTITAPTGTNLEYSINGSSYQPGTTFTNVSTGTYNVTVRNSATGCVSSASSVTVNAPPVPPSAPTATATQQPGCAVNTGQITITAPTGSGFEYSINGTSYQAGTVFNNVAPGTYNVTVRNTSTGCISSPAVVIINNAPVVPVTPTVSVTVQPSCTVSTGTVIITAPTGATLDYSINGVNFQAGTTFTGVAPGTYNVVTRNNLSGCISGAASITVTPVPTPPAAPSISSVTQPSCTQTAGSFVINAPVGANLEYSSNGNNWQTSATFSGLQPGNYSVTVRNTATGCVSSVTAVTINAVPAVPGLPVVAITTAATCTAPAATLTITSPIGSNLEYGINGTYQISPVFTSLQPGQTYTFTVRNQVSGCISSAVSQTIPALGCNDDLFVPNAFSPNGDGKNEILFVRGTSIRSMRFLIYNQWGEKVFESTNPAAGWDGKVSGKPQPVGVYMYVLRADMNDGTIINKKGSVTLVR